MALWRWRRRVPGVLFALCLLTAAVLAGLVAAAPWLEGVLAVGGTADRVMALFARDVAVRRTSLACAAGLTATAFVFFRPPYSRPPRAPSDVIGA